MSEQDPKVLEFRLQRLRKAPRNWTFWVAGFTIANGIFLIVQQDIMILAGLALPFAIPGPAAHFVGGAIFALIAYASNEIPKLLAIPLFVYIGDAFFSMYAQLWSGLIMHIVVLAFVGLSFVGIRAINKLLAQQSSVGV